MICDQHGATGGSLYMNRAELRALQNAGWDIGCHADTIAHHNAAGGLTALDAAGIRRRLRGDEAMATRLRIPSDHFAWPLGSHTAALRAIAAQYFSSQRGFRTNLNSFEADIYPFADATRLRQCAVTNGASPSSAATVTALIDTCMAAKKTLILTFHDIGNGGGGSEYPVSNFASVIAHIASHGYPVKTLTRDFRAGGLGEALADAGEDFRGKAFGGGGGAGLGVAAQLGGVAGPAQVDDVAVRQSHADAVEGVGRRVAVAEAGEERGAAAACAARSASSARLAARARPAGGRWR